MTKRRSPAIPRSQCPQACTCWTATPGRIAAAPSELGYPRPDAHATDQARRGADPLDGDADVLVCGASFAGLAVARELADSGARVLIVDRYEIGERQTSACAAPTQWLEAMGVGDSIARRSRSW